MNEDDIKRAIKLIEKFKPEPRLFIVGMIASKNIWDRLSENEPNRPFLSRLVGTRNGFKCGSLYVIESGYVSDPTLMMEVLNEKIKADLIYWIDTGTPPWITKWDVMPE